MTGQCRHFGLRWKWTFGYVVVAVILSLSTEIFQRTA